MAIEGATAVISRVLAEHAAADAALADVGTRLLQAMEAPAQLQSLDEPTLLAILARVPRYWHPVLHAVCKEWRVLVRCLPTHPITAFPCRLSSPPQRPSASLRLPGTQRELYRGSPCVPTDRPFTARALCSYGGRLVRSQLPALEQESWAC